MSIELHGVTVDKVLKAVHKLNNRPRKCLGWKTSLCLKNFQELMLKLWFRVFARDANSPNCMRYGIKVKKQLFKKTSIYKNTATVGGYNNTRYTYINGYYEAGKELVNISIGEQVGTYKKDTLFYPICYSYRHYIELHLKSLIMDIEILYDKMDTLGYLKNGTLSKKMSDELDKTHDLNKLFELFCERLNLVSDEKFPPEIKKYIKQMYDIDKNGQKFRYHMGTNKKHNFSKQEQFDLKNISMIMKEIHDLLGGVGGWLDHNIQMSNNIIQTIETEMRNYYY